MLLNTVPKSVIHINFVAGEITFDARPIWAALNEATNHSAIPAQINTDIQTEFGQSALHLGTRHYLMKVALNELKAGLTDVYQLVPEEWIPEVDRVVHGDDWNRVRDRVLAAVELFLYEFRAFLELLAKFSSGVLSSLGRTPPAKVQLASGETLELVRNGEIRTRAYLRYMCELLKIEDGWFQFLNVHRNFFTHEGAPYCAIEDRLMVPKEYDLLVMKGNIHDFNNADPSDYFRVSECAAVIRGLVSLSKAIQVHLIRTVKEVSSGGSPVP